MSFEPSSLERARKRAAARAITEKRNCIRACYGSASWKTNRSFDPYREVQRRDVLGGLIHEYHGAAA